MLESSLDVVVEEHATAPGVASDSLPFRLTTGRPLLDQWLQDTPSPGAGSLVDYLISAGCAHCFADFWAEAPRTVAPDPESVAVRTRLYRIELINHEPEFHALRRVVAQPETNAAGKPGQSMVVAAPSRGGAVALPAARPRSKPATETNLGELDWGDCPLEAEGQSLMKVMLSNFARAASKGNAPRWTLAWVTADTTGVDGWFRDDARKVRAGIREMAPEPVRVRVLDFMRSDETLDQGFLEQALLEGRIKDWRGMLRERAKALFSFPPLLEFASALLLLALLVGLWSMGALAGWLPGHEGLQGAWGLEDVLQTMPTLTGHAAPMWAELGSLAKVLYFVMTLLLVCWFLNRHLPVPLKVSLEKSRVGKWIRALRDAAKTSGVEVKVEGIVEMLPEWVWRSESSSRLWLRREFYGRRWPWSRSGGSNLVLLRNVDFLQPRDRQRLREITASCAENEALLVITQMTGLSMLTGAYLDVWLSTEPLAQKSRGSKGWRHWLLHDPASMRISLGAGSGIDDRKDADLTIQRILGLDDKGNPEKASENANTLVDGQWTLLDLLPTLVLGTTPQMYMKVCFSHTQIKWKSLEPQIQPIAKLFLSGSSLEEEELPQLKDPIGVYYWLNQGAGIRYLAGRVGSRRELAKALEIVSEIYKGSVHPDMRHEPPLAAELLARFTVGAEHWHLHKALEYLGGTDGKQALRDLPLHVEAALFLAEERLQLMARDRWPEPWERTLREKWADLHLALQAKELDPMTGTRCCTATLAAAAIWKLHSAPENEAICEPIKRLIKNPCLPEVSENGAAWGLFLNDLREALLKLAGLPNDQALQLLEAKISQDWWSLPSDIKQALRDSLADLGPMTLHDLITRAEVQTMLQSLNALSRRPALILPALSSMALLEVREQAREAGKSTDDTALLILAEAIMCLRTGAEPLTETLSPEDMRAIFQAVEQTSSREARRAALSILQSPEHVETLRKALAAGAEANRNLCTLGDIVEGAALGARSRVGGVFEDLQECRLGVAQQPASAAKSGGAGAI